MMTPLLRPYHIKKYKNGRERAHLALRGTLVNLRGELWVVTGYDPKRQLLWLAHDNKLMSLRPGDYRMPHLGLEWRVS